jgi:hypothetical protein
VRLLIVVALAVLAACRSKHDAPPSPTPAHAIGDAGVAELPGAPGVDPDSVYFEPHRPPTPAANHGGHPIDVTLRSTPSNALAAVDGVPLGNTPAYWSGMADGREHEFTFVLPRHAVARYRFVPITSGVVHARLEPIAEDVDAGVPPPELVPPPVVVPADAAQDATASGSSPFGPPP